MSSDIFHVIESIISGAGGTVNHIIAGIFGAVENLSSKV